jgi:replicative DNA helicase
VLIYDDKHCQMIRNLIEPEFWGGPYATVARRVYEYIDRFKKAPKDHVADLLADKLESKTGESNLYEDILVSARDASAGINTEYVLSQLETFVKRQTLRSAAIDLAKALQQDTDASLESAERIIANINRKHTSVFDAGLRLSNTEKVLSFLDNDNPAFPTGIPELDRRSFGPTRSELWLYIAAAKRGKTWMLIQLAKMASIHRLRVCHITLEMSEARTAQRYLQAFFAMSKHKKAEKVIKFDRDQTGHRTDNVDKDLVPKLSLEDKNITAKLRKKVDEYRRYFERIVIKQFPTGSLTVRQLEAYLDSLESTERFIPDLLIVDYPDLMRIDKDNYRLGIDEIYKDLRGIAVSRNVAVAVVSQTNRASDKARSVSGSHVAEAWSKIAHADCVISYNQTKAELDIGLARLSVTAGRNDKDKFDIVISQSYATGAFWYDSVLMDKEYWKQFPEGEK